MNLNVREIEERDIEHIAAYWTKSDPDYLVAMGVDLGKVPVFDDLEKMLIGQLELPYEKKPSYCTIWEVEGRSIGHCNIGDIVYNDSALMHLHIWKAADRRSGFGLELAKLSLPYFFNNINLVNLYCEPYALNPGPNRTVEKLGFEFIKEYETIPGSLNFKQLVKRWVLTRQKFENLSA